MRFTELKTLNTSFNPPAPPPAAPAMHPHCLGDPPTNDHPIQNPIKFSDITPLIGGQELSGMKSLWEEIAISESRLNLIAKLQEKKLGFVEIEQFSLGLKYSLRSEKMRENNVKPIQKVIRSAMELKIRDESFQLKDLKKSREQARKRVAQKYHHRSEKYRKIMKYLIVEMLTTG